MSRRLYLLFWLLMAGLFAGFIDYERRQFTVGMAESYRGYVSSR